MSAFADIYKQKHSIKKSLNYIPTSCSRTKYIFSNLSKFSSYITMATFTLILADGGIYATRMYTKNKKLKKTTEEE